MPYALHYKSEFAAANSPTENAAKPLIDMCFALDILQKQFDIFCNAKCDIFAKANKKGGNAERCNLKCEAKPRHHSLTANLLTANRLIQVARQSLAL